MASSITRAVLDFAKHILGHDITPRNNTTKAVLDAFLDEVAGHDVDTRGMGVPEIIDTITANYDGGGGDASFGDTPFPFYFTASAPVIGGEPSESEPCWFNAALVGGKTAASTSMVVTKGCAAAGVVIGTNTYAFTSCTAYKVVIDPDSETYSSVTEIEGIVEKVDTPYGDCYYLITIPELQGAWTEDDGYEGEQLHIYATTS